MKKRKSLLRRVASRARGESESKEPLHEVTIDGMDKTPDSSLSHGTRTPEPPQGHAEHSKQPSTTTAATAGRPYPQLIHHFVSVNEACEDIWKCQEPEQAAPWLQIVHHALLRTQLNAYVPAEVFFCISGAAHRFHDQSSHADKEALWRVWEDALWAAAALARVCVGPAWRHQLRTRRAWMQQKRHGLDDDSGSAGVVSESSPPEQSQQKQQPVDVVATDATARSFSPMTSSSLGILTKVNDAWYPPIPENLPAAMLRFAASDTVIPPLNTVQDEAEQQRWLDRRKSLAEAQRELVLALCYVLPEEEMEDPDLVARRLEWSILGAHDPVATMVRFWLESSSVSWPTSMEHKISTQESIATTEGEAIEDSAIVHVASESTNTEREKANDPTASVEHADSGLEITVGKDIHKTEEREEDIKRFNAQKIAAASKDESVDHRVDDTSVNQVNDDTHHPTAHIWNGALDSRQVDWWSTLQVVRACFHLVSAGWRMPQNEQGEEILAYFLEIAEKGMALHACQLKSDDLESPRDAREERLAASSSAMVAVTVLSAVASIGLIPFSMQSITVRVLCRLQVTRMKSEDIAPLLFPSVNPSTPLDEEEWAADRETFLEQREECSSDIAALKWVLLAHRSSAATAMSALLGLVNKPTVRRENVKSIASSSEKVIADVFGPADIVPTACVALDAISGALWGKPPDMPGIPSLRIYWCNVLDTLRGLASHVHDGIVQIDEMSGYGKANANTTCGAVTLDAFSLVVEIIVSLLRFTNAELMRGEGLLAPDEWDLFVAILDENIDKWLCTTDDTSVLTASSGGRKKIRSEARLLLDRLRNFLEDCSHLESSPFNLMVDGDCRMKLYTLLLRKAVPYMPPENGASLAFAVIRSWSSVGFSQHRSYEWARTASYIITDAFSVFEHHGFGCYNGYAHSPSIRLEALKSIALGEGEEERIFVAGRFDGTPHLSPLELTTHMREQHLALINGSILPPLMTMFGMQPSDSNRHVAVVIPLPVESFCSRTTRKNLDFYKAWEHDDESQISFEGSELALRRFALGLLGRLFRSVTGERWHRACFLEMIRSAAIKDAVQVIKSTSKASTCLTVGPTSTFPSAFHTSLMAIRELEKCLCLPFQDLPHAHESLPPVVDTLCSVLVVYGGESIRERNWKGGACLAMKRCLAMAAILPLARLASSHDKRLVLHKRYDFYHFIPAPILSLLIEKSFKGNHDLDDENSESTLDSVVAPFIVVSGDLQHGQQKPSSRSPRPSTGKTQLSFGPIFVAILATLRSNLESKRSRDQAATGPDSEEVDANFRSACYDALGSFMRSGIAFPFSKELISIWHLPHDPIGCLSEDLSRCRCIATVAEALAIKCPETSLVPEANGDSFSDIKKLLQYLLRFCASRHSRSVLCGCQCISGLAGFIAENMSICGLQVYKAVLQRLTLETRNIRNEPTEVTRTDPYGAVAGEALISVLYDIVCALPRNDVSLPLQMLTQGVDLISEICVSCLSQLSRSCRLLSVRLAAALLDRLSTYDTETSKAALEHIERHYSNLTSFLQQKMEETGIDPTQYRMFCQPKVLGDLIAQKLYGDAGTIQMLSELSLSYHEILAKETDDINRFVVESNNLDSTEHFAAWLCGHNVLICRIGSPKSRYRGWVEVVIRSPTSRKRRLIRLPSINSLDCPDLPSSLWSQPSSAAAKTKHLVETGSAEFPRSVTENSSEMEKAISLIEKFDNMFGHLNLDAKSLQLLADEEVPIFSATEQCSRNLEMSPVADVCGSQSRRRAVEGDEDTTSVQEWLCSVFGDHEREQCIVDELCSLGFTPQILKSLKSPPRLTGLGSHYLPMERLSFGPKSRRAVSILDRTPSLNTHKIALLFAAHASVHESRDDRSLEHTILSETAGSPQFLRFAEGLGKLVLTRHLKYYSGGLDTSGFDSDGKLAVICLDSYERPARNMVVFHTVALMPEGANNRKKHAGNDNVHIVYIDPSFQLDGLLYRGEEQTSTTVSGEFGFVIIFVVPLPSAEMVRVRIRLRDGLAEDTKCRLSHLTGEHLMSNTAAPVYVRQIATRADIACCTIMEDHFGELNWEERLRQISAMKRYVVSTQ